LVVFPLFFMLTITACNNIETTWTSAANPNTEANLTTETSQEPFELTQETKQPVQEATYLRGINLGNALESPPAEDWGVTIQETYFQTIREAGFNAVRIPVRFSDYTSPGPEYHIHEDFFKVVDNAVQWGLGNDLIVILDLHHFDAFKQDPQGEQEKFLAIWDQISERYQDMPPEMYFELLSEPSTNITSAFWNNALRDAITIIRETNPTRKILVNGIDYANVNALATLELPDDDNLIATFHYYEPFEFTHQGASWVSNSSNWIGTTWDGTNKEMAEIRESLDMAVEWSLLHETRVIIGEFGVNNTADPASRQAWFRSLTKEAQARGIGWFVWQFCSDFGIYDCDLSVWDEDILNTLQGLD